MPQSHGRRDIKHDVRPCDASPLPAAPVSVIGGPNSPTSALTGVSVEECNYPANAEQVSASPTGPNAQKSKSDKRYLGVRVRMPVRDMLRNFRIAKGMDPKDLQKLKGSKGDKKRVTTSGDRRNRLKTKSLEELAFIVEVLEEDLKTSTFPRKPPEHLRSTFCQEQRDKSWCEDISQQDLVDGSPPTSNFVTQSIEVDNPFQCSDYSQTVTPLSYSQGGYGSFEPAYCRSRFQPLDESEYQVLSPQETNYFSPKTEHWWGSPEKTGTVTYSCSVQEKWSDMTFFWTQIEREKQLLRGIPDQEFLALDEFGRTLLHRAVDEGKRALVYVIAKRMADLKNLDTRDAEGKTALHCAAQRNQHLIVADLISLGAKVNARDQYGKTCLHLSAEFGYIRVLEVLKSCMKSGTYVDLEARDMNGLSALQYASVALKSTVHELERSITEGQTRLCSLRKEQMMETIECLLQMECNLQYQVSQDCGDSPGHLEVVCPVTQLLLRRFGV